MLSIASGDISILVTKPLNAAQLSIAERAFLLSVLGVLGKQSERVSSPLKHNRRLAMLFTMGISGREVGVTFERCHE